MSDSSDTVPMMAGRPYFWRLIFKIPQRPRAGLCERPGVPVSGLPLSLPGTLPWGHFRASPKWESQEKRVVYKAGEGQCLPQECGLVSCLSLVNTLPLPPRQVTPSKVTQREIGRGTRWGKGVLTGERGMKEVMVQIGSKCIVHMCETVQSE